MSKNKVLDTALSLIDKYIQLNHKEIARKLYAETGYCDQDFNKFIAVITSGELTLREYIRKRRLYLAALNIVNNPDKSIVDISLEFGYSDQTAFARAIKRDYGKTPAEIRKENKNLPDVRKILENRLSNKSRLDSILERFESDNLSNTDWNYFEEFIRASDEMGFDTSTCCLISELSEKLSVPFGHLLEKCFDMAIDYNNDEEYHTNEITEFMEEIGVQNEDEMMELCDYYDCKWYELTFVKVIIYRLGIDSSEELEKMWKYYNCQWTHGAPFPLTKQMVQDYHNKHK
ncbi:AraC family transcriptional regulator [Ruminococcus flavefaciens]|uniref:helix-turn-helix domain-containing protein n=1 Tax=Ruminococcus flavefaciens TaxID=1265 RepID=UPI0026ED0A64|nr:helix-turn-helix domain-containing protein [Ruminococcus flavefaciens]